MSKSLEALEELKDEIIPDFALDYEEQEDYNDWIEGLYQTIKQDLDRLEELEKEYERLDRDHHSIYLDCCDLETENQKLKKAIDVLKDSLHLKVDFYEYDYYYKFVVAVADLYEHISSEEFELLKDVLRKYE